MGSEGECDEAKDVGTAPQEVVDRNGQCAEIGKVCIDRQGILSWPRSVSGRDKPPK